MPQLSLRLESSVVPKIGGLGQPNDDRAVLVLQVQPGAGLSAWAGVDAALAKREAARLAREAAVRDVRERVTLDWNEWVASRQRLQNANQLRTMSTEVSESYARQYVIGARAGSTC